VSAPTRLAHTVTGAADALAQQLAVPQPLPADLHWRAQSLTRGAAGIALLHIERAHAGVGSWGTAHTWVRAAADAGISAADEAGLHFGAPALSFVLHAAGTGRYGPALVGVDAHVSALTHRRVDLAQARIDRGELPGFAEYDLLRGVTGIGAHLLDHAPGGDALGRVLDYLVRLTAPLRTDEGILPGWWVWHDPHVTQSDEFRGGHANLGLAHGITGPLALLAQSLRRGITVDGHLDAIAVICAWLDTWRQDADTGPWWPQWITRDELRTGRSNQHRPLRPSWCYGTPGLARAQQLAGIATEDLHRQQVAEHALAGALSDPAQLARLTSPAICHGLAGLILTCWCAAADARSPVIAGHLPDLVQALLRNHADAARSPAWHQPGLVEGTAGVAMTLHSITTPDSSGWQTCLLIT